MFSLTLESISHEVLCCDTWCDMFELPEILLVPEDELDEVRVVVSIFLCSWKTLSHSIESEWYNSPVWERNHATIGSELFTLSLDFLSLSPPDTCEEIIEFSPQ